MGTPMNVPQDKPIRWKDQKNSLREAYPILTDMDLRYENGKKEDMLKRLESILDISREELEKAMIVA